MKRLILVPLTLMALKICAEEPQAYYESNLYAESTPAYTPPKPGQPTSTTYRSATPSAPSQSTIQQNYKSGQPPSYSNSQHPYGPPGAPSTNYQRPASSAIPQQQRTFPAHPYGPPGTGHTLAEAKINNQNYTSNANNNSTVNTNEDTETPYEKAYPENANTTAVNRPFLSGETAPVSGSELKNETINSRDQHKTVSDRELNKKIREEINGGFDDSFPGVTFITSEGVVVIEGYVPSIESHDKLEKNVSKIQGVKSVTNNTTVKSKR